MFPKWLQKRHRLWDETLTLLNRTTIPYRQLTIPCCADCNSKHLEPFEKTMSRAVRAGPNAVRVLDPYDVFIWIGKIFYGLLYRELLLPLDRSRKQKGRIVAKWLLKQYSAHHLFLQSVRVSMRFVNFFPASILILETEARDDPITAWDFSDNPPTMSIGCRMGTVGIIAVLQDGGTQQQLFFPKLTATLPPKLDPIQFREVMARVRYMARLFNRIPKYIFMKGSGGPCNVVQSPLQGYSRKPLFDAWKPREYAEVLSAMTRVSLERIFEPPDRVGTWLPNSDRT